MKKSGFLLAAIMIVVFTIMGCGGSDNKEVKIGNQVWTAENLNVDKFSNGDAIPQAKTVEEWQEAKEKGEPAWAYYENDPANGGKFGKLYNWFAVNDPRGLAPGGWRIPSDEDWKVLTEFLGNEGGSGIDEKSFNGLPGGSRWHDGSFDFIESNGFWWSSTEAAPGTAWYYSLTYYGSGVLARGNGDKGNGFSIRCIKD